MGVSSYGAGTRSSEGQVRITLDLTTSIAGKHVLIVEDIIDSGNTLASVMEMLQTRHPASLEVCTLLNKASRREVDIPIKYCGFIIPDKFVFGYGLDMDEFYRNLPFIGVVDLEKYEAGLEPHYRALLCRSEKGLALNSSFILWRLFVTCSGKTAARHGFCNGR